MEGAMFIQNEITRYIYIVYIVMAGVSLYAGF
ncbi:hypothetical protein SAMN05421720_104156 [Rhodospira trueperi]|uniref:Uncharacterized protein n=1 Tax=Rhodospira trueperi TaxID=69960 RepID=A0A1G7AZ53_9PROT|nr:hypothetical protein SAMN05421720_104156 [Rhodospira trueperi]